MNKGGSEGSRDEWGFGKNRGRARPSVISRWVGAVPLGGLVGVEVFEVDYK